MGTTKGINDSAPVDRFDLEEAIMACFNVADDLALVISEVLEGSPTPDETVNMLEGLAAVHKLRCHRAFTILEELINSGDLS